MKWLINPYNAWLAVISVPWESSLALVLLADCKISDWARAWRKLAYPCVYHDSHVDADHHHCYVHGGVHCRFRFYHSDDRSPGFQQR
jgi:hypothetical protein